MDLRQGEGRVVATAALNRRRPTSPEADRGALSIAWAEAAAARASCSAAPLEQGVGLPQPRTGFLLRLRRKEGARHLRRGSRANREPDRRRLGHPSSCDNRKHYRFAGEFQRRSAQASLAAPLLQCQFGETMGKRFELDNGLRVVFEEQHASKVAAFQVWVNAGSADEQPHEVGLAHLHEHMLFKGTGRRRPGEIAREIEERGGEINAWTSFDQTVYHVVLASQFAQVGLDVLADAIRNSAFDAEELSKEIEVVCEEIRRANDLPARRASRDLFATAYRVHPYRRPVIGTEDSVRSFTRERVLGFYGRNYAPPNMVLAAAGDFSEEDLKRWADELCGGDWGRTYGGSQPRPPEPPRAEQRLLVREDEAKEAYVNLAFGIPSVEHEDAPALDLLAVLLGQGEASRLVLEVKRKRSLVNDIRAFAYTPRDPGLMVASMTLPPQKIVEALAT